MLELERLHLDAGPVRRLEQLGVGRGDATPTHRVQIGGEAFGVVEPARGYGSPTTVVNDLGIRFVLPEHMGLLAEGVVFEAGEVDEGGVTRSRRQGDVLDQILARADADDGAGGEGHAGGRDYTRPARP